MALTKKQKKALIRIVIALIAFIALFVIDKIVELSTVIGGKNGWLLPFALYFAVYVYIGYDVLWRALRNITRGQVLDENFLMCLATIGAFALAIFRGVTGQSLEGFDEACAVLLFYQIGEWFQAYATGRSRRSISALMDIRPDYANVVREKTIVVDPSEVKIGETIIVNPGEKIPLDGVIKKGATTLDVKALTGESLPRDVAEGDEVISGSVNLTSQIQVEVKKEFYDSTVSKILDLVENASNQKSKAENFITKFARYYTPAVVIVALLLAVVPGIITSDWSVWVYRALSFLVVSCPCALVISIPLSFFAGIGAASRYGILIKGSNYLEKFNKANVFVFDKTGTLTKGNFAVTKIVPQENRDEILRLAAIAEHGSAHPIARSVLSAYAKPVEGGYSLTNVAGAGVIAKSESDVIYCGNEKLMKQNGINYVESDEVGTVVYVALNDRLVGSILIRDEIKEESYTLIKDLNELNCKTVMLTGDNEGIAKNVAHSLGLTSYKASLLPQNKANEVENMLLDKADGDVLCFVGDGINDAPALMRSDIGIAMGGVGSDAAIEASDIVLMRDDLKGIALAKRISKKTMNVVMQNIVFSIVVKLAILILAALGIAGMWLAVFGDVGVAVIAILNAMRVNGSYGKNK